MSAVRTRGNRRLRWLDRYPGVAVLVAGGVLRRWGPARRRPDAVGRIGLLKMTAIGDTVLLAGIVADLRDAFPQAAIVMFCGRDNAGVAALIPGLTEVVVVPATQPVRVVRELRAHHCDILLDCGNWSRLEAVYTAAAGAAFSVGFETAGQRRHYCHDRAVHHSPARHELDNYRALVAAIGVRPHHPPVLEPAGVLAEAQRPNGPYGVLHPWPSGLLAERKEWPADRWVELGRWLDSRGLTPVLTGGPADREASAALAARLRQAGLTAIDTAGRLNLAELTDLLAGSRCVVSVNTGIMHVAAALGAATVSLNGPTAAGRWGPVGARAVSVDSTLPGCGYLNLGWEYDGQRADCMCGISVEAVTDAIDGLLAPVEGPVQDG